VLIDRTSPLSRGFHRLLDLLLMGLAQDRAEELLDPHRHLPAYPLVHLGGAVPLSRGTVVPIPNGRVLQDLPCGVDTLLAEPVQQTGGCLFGSFRGPRGRETCPSSLQRIRELA
jgi:hypothetical protein